jgi:predicted Zn-dependent protease
MPNGSFHITTGLLAPLENEAQLAGVLGHETAHIDERHPYLENRSLRKKTVASEIISAGGRGAGDLFHSTTPGAPST